MSFTPNLRVNRLDVLGTLYAGGSDAQPNSLTITGSAAGSAPNITPAGPDTSIPLVLSAKNDAAVRLQANGARVADFTGPTNSVNALSFMSSGTGQPVSIRTVGSDANCSILIAPSGVGSVTVSSPMTVTGFLTLTATPTQPYHAVTRAYVDAVAFGQQGIDLSAYLPKTGGTLTGPLTLSGAPTAPNHAVTKAYVDNSTPAFSGTGFLRAFSFIVQFNNTDPASFSNVPAGWGVTLQSQNVLQVTHSVGARPAGAMVWGQTPIGDTWTQRSVGNLALNLSYSRANVGTFFINGVSTTSTGAGSGLQAEFHIFFGA